MKKQFNTGRILSYPNLRILRIGVQLLFLSLFIFLLAGGAGNDPEKPGMVSWFFYFDPLVMILNFLSGGGFRKIFLLALIPLLLTLFLGRFYCGWICPLGSVNQFLSRLHGKSRGRKLPHGLFRLKYFILVTVIVTSVAGVSFGSWLDPNSFLTRSIASLTPAALNIRMQAEGLFDSESDELALDDPVQDGPVLESLPGGRKRSSTQPLLLAGLFVTVLIVNRYHSRFFCNYICPLGALYGLVSRSGLARIRRSDTCISCNKCSAGCSYGGGAGYGFMKSECKACLNCTASCKSRSAKPSLELPAAEDVRIDSIGRRRLIATVAAGIAFSTLSGSSVNSGRKVRHGYIRPPGSAREDLFLDLCARCGQCTQVCPTGFIQPAFLEAGLEGLWTPVVNADAGYCEFSCRKCTAVCPTGAIAGITLREKQSFRIGTAVIDRTRCFTYADGFNCTACADNCPTPEKAIRFRPFTTWNYQGMVTTINQAYVNPDLCIGCGICQAVCPRQDSPAIFITADGEDRQLASGTI